MLINKVQQTQKKFVKIINQFIFNFLHFVQIKFCGNI